MVVKQSQFHCRIVRRCSLFSGISVLRSTAAGWLVAFCTDALRWQVHASAALNLCRASWVSLAHFTWNCCRHDTQTRVHRTWARYLLHSGHFLTVVARGGSARVVGSVERRCKGIEICWGKREQGWLLTAMFVWQKRCYWVETALSASLDGGAIRAAAYAASVDQGTLLLISSQAVAVPMEETLALGADDWMGFNADGTGAPGAFGPSVHLDVPRPMEKYPEVQGGVGNSVRRKRGLCASHSASWVCWAKFEDLRP